MTNRQGLPSTSRTFRCPDCPVTAVAQAGELLTAKELQQLLKISVKTIYNYAQRGLIPYVRIQSNVRFPKQQILKWIERQTYHPRPAERRP